jgi:hypothetical protein
VNMTPGIRGINRATVEADTATGLYVVDASIVVRAPSASDALRQVEEAIAPLPTHYPRCNDRCGPSGHYLKAGE